MRIFSAETVFWETCRKIQLTKKLDRKVVARKTQETQSCGARQHMAHHRTLSCTISTQYSHSCNEHVESGRNNGVSTENRHHHHLNHHRHCQRIVVLAVMDITVVTDITASPALETWSAVLLTSHRLGLCATVFCVFFCKRWEGFHLITVDLRTRKWFLQKLVAFIIEFKLVAQPVSSNDHHASCCHPVGL